MTVYLKSPKRWKILWNFLNLRRASFIRPPVFDDSVDDYQLNFLVSMKMLLYADRKQPAGLRTKIGSVGRLLKGHHRRSVASLQCLFERQQEQGLRPLYVHHPSETIFLR
jgi:hypothetical protein